MLRTRRHFLHHISETTIDTLRDAFRPRVTSPHGTIAAAAALASFTTATVLGADGDWKPGKDPKLIPTGIFEIDPSLEVTVWATTPLLYNPTNMDIDHVGRVWVAEGVNYRGRKGTRAAGDRIAVLQDTDGDGKCDSSHTFVQEAGLIAPLGVAVFDNVVYVAQPPDLLAYTDVNRDLRFDPSVDKREVILTGFNAINHDHSLHSVTAGPDGKFYRKAGPSNLSASILSPPTRRGSSKAPTVGRARIYPSTKWPLPFSGPAT